MEKMDLEKIVSLKGEVISQEYVGVINISLKIPLWFLLFYEKKNTTEFQKTQLKIFMCINLF